MEWTSMYAFLTTFVSSRYTSSFGQLHLKRNWTFLGLQGSRLSAKSVEYDFICEYLLDVKLSLLYNYFCLSNSSGCSLFSWVGYGWQKPRRQWHWASSKAHWSSVPELQRSGRSLGWAISQNHCWAVAAYWEILLKMSSHSSGEELRINIFSLIRWIFLFPTICLL